MSLYPFVKSSVSDVGNVAPSTRRSPPEIVTLAQPDIFMVFSTIPLSVMARTLYSHTQSAIFWIYAELLSSLSRTVDSEESSTKIRVALTALLFCSMATESLPMKEGWLTTGIPSGVTGISNSAFLSLMKFESNR